MAFIISCRSIVRTDINYQDGFEADVNGDLMPTNNRRIDGWFEIDSGAIKPRASIKTSSSYFETDANSDIQPISA